MIIHSLRSSLCDKVTYSHQSKKKRGFANYSLIQTFHGTFIKKYWCIIIAIVGNYYLGGTGLIRVKTYKTYFLQLLKLQFTWEHHCVLDNY